MPSYFTRRNFRQIYQLIYFKSDEMIGFRKYLKIFFCLFGCFANILVSFASNSTQLLSIDHGNRLMIPKSTDDRQNTLSFTKLISHNFKKDIDEGAQNDFIENKLSHFPTLMPLSKLVLESEDANILGYIDSDLFYREESEQYEKLNTQQHAGKVASTNNTAKNEESDGGSEPSHSSNRTPKIKPYEYDEKSVGSMLETFGGGENGGNDATYLPVFLTEPESTFVVKNRPAVLKCKAAHALQVSNAVTGTSSMSCNICHASVSEMNNVEKMKERAVEAKILKYNLPILHAYINFMNCLLNISYRLDFKKWRLHFKCSGSSQPPPSFYDKHVDPHTGVHLEEVTATINRDLVDEYFGKGAYKCECQAWSSRGIVKSRAAFINVAYIRKQFLSSPTSLRVELGSTAELHCEPPNGYPTPKITWLKNDLPMTEMDKQGMSVSAKGVLSFQKVILTDMANYSCAAENISGKRTSEAAVLIVYANGGWGSWSPWVECTCSDRERQGKKRIRSCNSPVPMNGGLQCSGPQIQKSIDCMTCTGRWSPWSEWSTCSSDCLQFRRRKCLTYALENKSTGVGLAESVSDDAGLCFGNDFQTAECRGELCHIGKDEFDWALYMGLIFIAIICFTFGAVLIYCARRGIEGNANYNMGRTQYIQGVDKKINHVNLETGNINYEYTMDHRCAADKTSLNYALPEHHYDVPNLSANYINPIDELNMEYLTDTADTSTCTSNSTYDITNKLHTLSLSKKSTSRLSVVREIFHSSGGRLRLYNGEIMLYIPTFSIGKNQKKHVALMVLSDDAENLSIPCTKSLMVCSAIVNCSPSDCVFLKPVILKIPHCLTNRDQWNVSIYHSENHHGDLNVSWRMITTVGQETINTPIFAQLDPSHAYLMTEQLGRYAIVADPKPCFPITEISIRMKLIAFMQMTPNTCILRIYIVRDFPYSKDICSRIEAQIGGTFLAESSAFEFNLNNGNLLIRVRPLNDDGWESSVSDEQEQVIPYAHIISNNSILHCEFSLKRNEQYCMGNNFDVGFMQGNSDKVEEHLKLSLLSRSTVISNKNLDKPSTVYMDSRGNCVSDIGSLETVQLPTITKRKICAALDPPRMDENDWRLLASKLNTDRYIAYFATKPSPTEQILNLLECRANNSFNVVTELLAALQEMNRQDVVSIIEQTLGQQWI